MTKEKIQEFSALQAEPTWLTDLRLKAFDKIAELDLPVIERVKFHRWNLGDGSLATNDEIGAVPDFTAIGDNPMLVQVGSQTILEQLPVAPCRERCSLY
ncbi:ABC transporter permease [Streptococcus suis]|nr:ABC transporter permease [Streptococcus suis]